MKGIGARRHPLRSEGAEYPTLSNESLPGEDSRSMFLEDAVHWVSVYGELLTFTRSLARGADGAACALDGDRQWLDGDRQPRDGGALDIDGLIERYEERHEFWQRCARELAGYAGH